MTRPVISSSTILQGPMIDTRTGSLTRDAMNWFQGVQRVINTSLNSSGQFIGSIDPTATVGNRSEGIGTDLQNIDNGGVITANGIDFARAYHNKDTDHIADGDGHPLAGGRAAYEALIANPPLAQPHQWINALDPVSGDFTQAQPDYSDLAGRPTLPSSISPVPSEWLNGYSALTGTFSLSQPAFLDISGTADPTQLPIATAGSFGVVKPDGTTVTISSGVISAVGGGGGVFPSTKTPVASEWINSYDATTGLFTQTQPAFTDVTGTATPAQLPVATGAAFGAVKPDNTTITISGGVISSVGGGSSPNFADAETPTGTINGINVTFTLAHSPSPAVSLVLSLAGQIMFQDPSGDYTVSGASITFAVAPNIGPLLAWYRY